MTGQPAFTARALEAALRGLRFGLPLHFFDTLGSTNDEARRLAEAGAPEGTLVAADEQTAGRGRAGRGWQTPRGAALAASFIVRPSLPPAQLARLTMLGGLAAAEAVEAAAGVPAQLKWPNDVLVQGKKAAGVLTEASVVGPSLAYAVIGIGLNVNLGPHGATHFPAISLAEAAGRPIDRVALLQALAENLSLYYPAIHGDALRDAWAARLAWRGQAVLAKTGAATVEGIAEGVDADGALRVRLESGQVVSLTAADVRLRPAPPASAPPTQGPGGSLRPEHFIGEPVEAGFDQAPTLQKRPGCPSRFTWRGATYPVVELLAEWHDYRRRGRMARNMQPAHAAAAETRGSWGVGRDFFRVRVAGGRVFDLYYDRSPKGPARRQGEWVLFAELAESRDGT